MLSPEKHPQLLEGAGTGAGFVGAGAVVAGAGSVGVLVGALVGDLVGALVGFGVVQTTFVAHTNEFGLGAAQSRQQITLLGEELVRE